MTAVRTKHLQVLPREIQGRYGGLESLSCGVTIPDIGIRERRIGTYYLEWMIGFGGPVRHFLPVHIAKPSCGVGVVAVVPDGEYVRTPYPPSTTATADSPQRPTSEDWKVRVLRKYLRLHLWVVPLERSKGLPVNISRANDGGGEHGTALSPVLSRIGHCRRRSGYDSNMC